jgi:hypothetical protein
VRKFCHGTEQIRLMFEFIKSAISMSPILFHQPNLEESHEQAAQLMVVGTGCSTASKIEVTLLRQ